MWRNSVAAWYDFDMRVENLSCKVKFGTLEWSNSKAESLNAKPVLEKL